MGNNSFNSTVLLFTILIVGLFSLHHGIVLDLKNRKARPLHVNYNGMLQLHGLRNMIITEGEVE
jgi:hypothetical protein